MRDQLPGNYRQMLRPYAFRGGELHKAVMDFAVFYGSLCRLKFPELSVPLILYQYVRDLALPSKWLGTASWKCPQHLLSCSRSVPDGKNHLHYSRNGISLSFRNPPQKTHR